MRYFVINGLQATTVKVPWREKYTTQARCSSQSCSTVTASRIQFESYQRSSGAMCLTSLAIRDPATRVMPPSTQPAASSMWSRGDVMGVLWILTVKRCGAYLEGTKCWSQNGMCTYTYRDRCNKRLFYIKLTAFLTFLFCKRFLKFSTGKKSLKLLFPTPAILATY